MDKKIAIGINDVGAIFRDRLIDLVGEAQAIQLGEYAAKLAVFSHKEMLGMLCEGWLSDKPLAATIELLERLDQRITLRALLAQRLCSNVNSGIIQFSSMATLDRLLPFYRSVSGLDSEALQALRQTDTAPNDLGSI